MKDQRAPGGSTLGAVVAIALVAAVVAEHVTPRAGSTRCSGGGDAVLAELAAELVAAPLDRDVLAALVAIALAAVVAELATGVPGSTRRPGGGRRPRRGAGTT